MARINSNLYVPTARVSETETIEIAAVMQQRNGMDEPITLAGVMAHRPDIDPSAPWQPVSSSNPLEVRVRELEAELQQLRQLFQGGDAKVQLSGSVPVIWGANISERPAASEVPVGTQFILANENLDAWVSNGTDWVVI